jgi:hypothetical protein
MDPTAAPQQLDVHADEAPDDDAEVMAELPRGYQLRERQQSRTAPVASPLKKPRQDTTNASPDGPVTGEEGMVGSGGVGEQRQPQPKRRDLNGNEVEMETAILVGLTDMLGEEEAQMLPRGTRIDQYISVSAGGYF